MVVAIVSSWRADLELAAKGYKVMRLKFKAGKPAGFEDFLTGFYVPGEKGQFGRPCGLELMPDGSMLVSDDAGGVIYQITNSEGP